MDNKCYQDGYLSGVTSRNGRPLPSGAYKLRERHVALVRAKMEVENIRNFVCRRGTKGALMSCTPEDKHIWLKATPLWLARILGEDLVPGLKALVHDGVPVGAIQDLEPHIQASAKRLVASCEAVRLRIAKRIENEYREMRAGDSLVEPLLDEAIWLFERVLLLLPRQAATSVHVVVPSAGSNVPSGQRAQ